MVTPSKRSIHVLTTQHCIKPLTDVGLTVVALLLSDDGGASPFEVAEFFLVSRQGLETPSYLGGLSLKAKRRVAPLAHAVPSRVLATGMLP